MWRLTWFRRMLDENIAIKEKEFFCVFVTFIRNIKMLFSLFIREFPFNDKFDGVFKNTYNDKDVSVVASWSREKIFLRNLKM